MADSTLTIEDVNRRLPLVRRIVRDTVELKSDILERQERLLELRELHPELDDDDSLYAEEVLQMEESLETDEIRIDELARELSQIGGDLVSPELGLVEFESLLEGQAVRLSWMYDEPEVGFWRSATDEPAERKPLQFSGHQAG